MIEHIIRIAKVTAPSDVATNTLLTVAIANLGVPVAEQHSLADVILLENETSAGVQKSTAGGKCTISGANLLINEPTAGFEAGDILTVGFVIGTVPSAEGVDTTP